MKTALKEKFITEKSFYRNLLAIAGPMAFQYAISFGVTLMDSVMLGSLGDVAISGANLGNQMQTLVMSCSYGLASGGGGDTRMGFLLDCGTLWLTSIPLGFFTGLVLHWPVPAVYACLKIDSPVKVLLSLIRIKGGHWVRNVTVQEGIAMACAAESKGPMGEKTGQ